MLAQCTAWSTRRHSDLAERTWRGGRGIVVARRGWRQWRSGLRIRGSTCVFACVETCRCSARIGVRSDAPRGFPSTACDGERHTEGDGRSARSRGIHVRSTQTSFGSVARRPPLFRRPSGRGGISRRSSARRLSGTSRRPSALVIFEARCGDGALEAGLRPDMVFTLTYWSASGQLLCNRSIAWLCG